MFFFGWWQQFCKFHKRRYHWKEGNVVSASFKRKGVFFRLGEWEEVEEVQEVVEEEEIKEVEEVEKSKKWWIRVKTISLRMCHSYRIPHNVYTTNQ